MDTMNLEIVYHFNIMCNLFYSKSHCKMTARILTRCSTC